MIVFIGNFNGVFDIFFLNIDIFEICNLINDDIYDVGFLFLFDGLKIVFILIFEENGDFFEIDFLNLMECICLIEDEYYDIDLIYFLDGCCLFFMFDCMGVENIYGLEFEMNELFQYINMIIGVFQFIVLVQFGLLDCFIYIGFWKSCFDLYQIQIDELIKVMSFDVIEDVFDVDLYVCFEFDIQVVIDEMVKELGKKFCFFFEDVLIFVGVDDNQMLIGQVFLQFIDFYGDCCFMMIFQFIDSFLNFDVFYWDLLCCWQWQLYVFDNWFFFIGWNFQNGCIECGLMVFQQIGLWGMMIYLFGFNCCVEFSFGFFS